MELTKEQLLQIDNYVFVCGIKYYDVRTEIVDHFANILEQKLEENLDLDFKKEIQNIHRDFSDGGFSKLLKEKTKSVQKRFYKASFKHFITFFKLPKIIISGSLFYALYLLMNWFESVQDFLGNISIISLTLFTIYFVVFAYRQKKKVKFLAIERTSHFNIMVMNVFQLYFQFVNAKSSEFFLNSTNNNIQLAIFVFIILLYWSGEYVYHQHKKEVQKQYPNILV